MKIAIVSGKGGTGKTFIAVNLAAVSGGAEYLDCDVEEPNGHLFLKPTIESEEIIQVMLPEVDNNLCCGSRKCVEFCRFNALAYIKDRLFIFEEVCHSCGGCVLVCPQNAILESSKVIGKIQRGASTVNNGNNKGNIDVDVVTGVMNVGQASGVPIISRMIEESDKGKHKLALIDSPPGSACVVMESIKDADYCLMVAEPTVFGAHNLEMVHELVELFQKPHGVVLNKCTQDVNPSEEYCQKNDIPIVGRIPFDHELGLINAKGGIVSLMDEKYRKKFRRILEEVQA